MSKKLGQQTICGSDDLLKFQGPAEHKGDYTSGSYTAKVGKSSTVRISQYTEAIDAPAQDPLDGLGK